MEGRKMLFRLVSTLHERTTLIETTNLDFAEGSQVIGDAKKTIASPGRLTHHCDVIETGNESYGLKKRG